MKKITVKTDLIKKALPKLGAAVNGKILPILENIYCKAEDGNISLIGSDMEMTIRYNLIAEVEESAEFLLPYHLFSNIIRLCKNEIVTLTVLSRSVRITTGSDVFELKNSFKIGEFPLVKEMPSGSEIVLDDLYLPYLMAASDTVGKEEGRPALNRVLLSISKTGIEIASTDAFVLYSYNIPGEYEAETQLLLSPRMLKAIDGMRQILVRWDDKRFLFESPEISIVITRPDFKYPDHKSIIPPFQSNLGVSKSEMVMAFQKLNLSSEFYKDAKLSIGASLIKAIVDDENTGLKINADIVCDYTGTVDTICLNAANVLRVLQQTDCEDLKLAVHSPSKAVLVRGEDKNYLALILPTFK